MENKDWRDQFLKIHYEPEHERGQTCWCIPKTIVTDGIAEIIHNEQRVVLVSLIESILKSKQEEIEGELEKMKKEIDLTKTVKRGTATNANRRKMNYNLALDDLKPIISNILK